MSPVAYWLNQSSHLLRRLSRLFPCFATLRDRTATAWSIQLACERQSKVESRRSKVSANGADARQGPFDL